VRHTVMRQIYIFDGDRRDRKPSSDMAAMSPNLPKLVIKISLWYILESVIYDVSDRVKIHRRD